MYPHRIRLREPWDREQTAGSGVMRFQRKFGRPSRIDEHERLWLTVSNAPSEGTLSVNGRQLGGVHPAGSVEFEVTELLERRNQVVIEYPDLRNGAGVPGEVALEVRCSAFLRNVHCRFDEVERLHVICDVVGACDSRLELYVLVNDRTAIYTTVTTGSETSHVELVSEDTFSTRSVPSQFRVELVKGATVWFRWEATG